MLEEEQRLWQQGITHIAGVDEVGRGPLAGPVVAAACILPKNSSFPEIKDSKALSEKKREEIFAFLTTHQDIYWSVHLIDHEIVDQINILQATLLAMQKAVNTLKIAPDYVLVDGRDIPSINYPAKALIKGDTRSQSIAAASIIAKCYRDDLMRKHALKWPEYGFVSNKGYGTKAHIKALQEHGPCPLHRKTFIKKILPDY